jgi:hypothetical protein
VRFFHVRPTHTPALPTRLRRLAGGATAAVLAVTLAPGAAAQEATDSATEAGVSVRLKVATQPAVEIAVAPRAWPTRVVQDAGVDVDGNDLVRVVRDGRRVVDASAKRVRDGDTVRLIDVEKHRKTRTAPVPAPVVEVPTTTLAPGRRKVVREGRAGVREVVAVRTLHNSEPVSFRVVARKVVREPRPRRVLVGRQPWSVPGTDGLNWAALARCESGGNPRAVNPAGYYGLYQFNVGTWNSVGGSGMPHHASADEQTYRAKLLYKSRGRSPWPHCGRLL